MPEPIVFTQKGGRLIQERAPVTLVNNTLLTERIVVPANKIWWLYAVSMLNGDDVDRHVLAEVVDSTNAILHELSYKLDLVPTDIAGFPAHENITPAGTEGKIPLPFPVLGGNKIQLTWHAGGASAGGTGYYMLTYLEVDM